VWIVCPTYIQLSLCVLHVSHGMLVLEAVPL
jgi:hypothetical protein